MGNDPEKKSKKKKPDKVEVDNEDALIWGGDSNNKNKIKRKGDDGTTIVFYKFPDVSFTAPVLYKGEGAGSDIDSKKEIDVDLKIKISSANKLLKDRFFDATKKIEGIADIKFFDIDNLSEENIKYLSQQHVRIASKADIKPVLADLTPLSKVQKKFIGGLASPPGGSSRGSMRNMLLVEENISNADNEDILKCVVGHEFKHCLGLKHPFETTKHNNKILKAKLDVTGNTTMSKNFSDNSGQLYYTDTPQELDVKALIKLYGKSKNPTPGLEESLQAEEIALAAKARAIEIESKKWEKIKSDNDEFYSGLGKVIERLISDGSFDKSALENLSREAELLKNRIFDPEELKLLKEKKPQFGILRLTDMVSGEDIINIGNGVIVKYTDIKGMEGLLMSDNTFKDEKFYELDIFGLKNISSKSNGHLKI